MGILAWCLGSESHFHGCVSPLWVIRGAAGKTAALAACALAAGCGGGGDDAQPVPTSVPVCAPAEVVQIQLFGDSTMRGPENSESPFRVHKLVQADMDARFGAGTVVVKSEAIGGTKASDLVYGTRGFYAWPTGVTGDIVVDNHGVNDAAASHRTPIATYKAELRIIASRPGVMLQTPVPMNTDITDPAVGTAENDTYAEAMRQVAAETGAPVIEVHRYVLGLPHWKALLSDGIHPTPELYAMIARDVMAPALAQRVAVLKCQPRPDY